MSITRIPAKTEVVVVEPESFTLAVTRDELAKLRALVGITVGGNGDGLADLYDSMVEAMREADVPRVVARSSLGAPPPQGLKFFPH